MSGKTKVLMVDDNAVMLLGLTEAVSIDPELESVGTAESASEALEMYRKHRPDVVTMDYEMPGESGVDCTKKILEEFPDAKVVLLSIYETEEDIWQALQAGVKGYLTKKTGEIEEVLEAIHEVAAGNTFFPSSISRKIDNRRRHLELTPRELEILRMLGRGCSNKELMEHFGLSVSTVKNHLINIREKLGAADRTQAVIIAIRRGLLRLDYFED